MLDDHSTHRGAETGIILYSLDDLSLSFKLEFPFSNVEAECEALTKRLTSTYKWV